VNSILQKNLADEAKKVMDIRFLERVMFNYLTDLEHTYPNQSSTYNGIFIGKISADVDHLKLFKKSIIPNDPKLRRYCVI
jgi:hypothetical protein